MFEIAKYLVILLAVAIIAIGVRVWDEDSKDDSILLIVLGSILLVAFVAM